MVFKNTPIREGILSLLNNVQNVEECDATESDQGTQVDNTTFNFNFKELAFRIKEPQRLNCPRLVGVQ